MLRVHLNATAFETVMRKKRIINKSILSKHVLHMKAGEVEVV